MSGCASLEIHLYTPIFSISFIQARTATMWCAESNEQNTQTSLIYLRKLNVFAASAAKTYHALRRFGFQFDDQGDPSR